MTTITLYRHDAIDYAAATGGTVSKYADPTEGARDGLSISEAREIARQDPGLLWAEVEITDRQIEALRSEAAEAGDLAMVDTCDRALAGNSSACAECACAIGSAYAAAND